MEEEFFVFEQQKRYKVDLRKRLLDFAVSTMKFLNTLPRYKEYDVFKYQLSKAVTSIGANYEEAQGAYSNAEFKAKIGICLKEAREANYFYLVLDKLDSGEELSRLLNESTEIKKIFGSILVNIRNKTTV